MNFGELLKKECNNELSKQIYEDLKPALLTCAKKREKGCKISISNISDDVIKDLFDMLEEDGILVEENEYLIWDKAAIKPNPLKTPDPCSLCFKVGPERWSCCGCHEKLMWDRTKPKEEKNLYYVLSTVFISLEDDKIKIVTV